MTGKCYGGIRHLPAIPRRDGSIVCARCGTQLQPPSPERAWGRAVPKGEGGQYFYICEATGGVGLASCVALRTQPGGFPRGLEHE
jgi:hypothetical protein